MDPVSFLPSLLALALALITTKIICVIAKDKPGNMQFISIDGLRGYLAFFVFLHHSCIWYFYLQTNIWKAPPSHLYTHFGQSSVAMFFMITGFLFASKLNNASGKNIDWMIFFISRIMRLLPLYFFAISILILVVAVLSGFMLHEPMINLVRELILWGSFTILGAPLMNSVRETYTIMAGVTWSLVYEWLFYISLPLANFVFFRKKTSILLILTTALIIAAIIRFNDLSLITIFSFFGGIAASFLIRSTAFSSWAKQKSSSVIALCTLTIAIVISPNAQNYISMSLVSITFIIIACGNTLFGILSSQISRAFGKMAYGIYLLHGIILFITFKFIIGKSVLSPLEHWSVVLCCIPPLILICYTLHIYIELPFMQASSKVSALGTKYYNSLVNNLISEKTSEKRI
jgi:peptidoglycan/LPS O-acetylase OafA/YrhL